LVVVAVLFGIGQARTRYYYCEALGFSASDPCAHEGHGESRCPVPSLDRSRFDCCEVITMPSVPEGARSVEPIVPSAGVSPLLPALEALLQPLRDGGIRFVWDAERWRSPPRAPGERRAQLMVFLT
jgi:hypothetical protein